MTWVHVPFEPCPQVANFQVGEMKESSDRVGVALCQPSASITLNIILHNTTAHRIACFSGKKGLRITKLWVPSCSHFPLKHMQSRPSRRQRPLVLRTPQRHLLVPNMELSSHSGASTSHVPCSLEPLGVTGTKDVLQYQTRVSDKARVSTRGKISRSKSGCKCCKRSRVKCDEIWPRWLACHLPLEKRGR